MFYKLICSSIGILLLSHCATHKRPQAAAASSRSDVVVEIKQEITFKTGEPTIQYFPIDLKKEIVRIFDIKGEPPVWGVLNVKGVGSNIAIIQIQASGFPGKTAKSRISFKAICRQPPSQ